MSEAVQNVCYTLRMLRRSPGFTAVAVATLALGIGANTAVFTLVDALLLKTLPVAEPDRLVLLSPASPRTVGGGFEARAFEILRDRAASQIDLFAFTSTPLAARVGGQPEAAAGGVVSESSFRVLGVRPILGRSFESGDDRPGAPPVAVLAHGYWRRRFGSDPAVVGRTIDIKRIPFRVIGVASPGFSGLEPSHACDVWVSLAFWPALRLKDNVTLGVMGRLRPGVTPDEARTALTSAYRDALSEADGFAPSPERQREIAARSIVLRPGAKGTEELREELGRRLGLLMGAAGLVLLIACANVANLLLARAASRRKEIAVRLALGAGRGRLVRQLVTESFVLALFGSGAGLLAAAWGSSALLAAVASPSLKLSPAISLRVLLFATAVSLLTLVLFGLAPALRATALNPAADLKLSPRPERFRRRLPLAGGLVASQFALSLALVVGAGLLARSLGHLHRVDPGFRRDSVLLFWLYPTLAGIEGSDELDVYARVRERLERIPGVQAASYFRFGFFAGRWKRAATPDSAAATSTDIFCDAVGPAFFQTMGVPVRSGREFSPRDSAGRPRVALVNQTAATRLFSGESPIGRRIVFAETEPGSDDGAVDIVGVVGDTRTFALREGDPRSSPGVVYIPVTQAPPTMLGQMNFAVRGNGNPRELLPEAAARAVASVERDLPLTGIRTLAEQVDNSLDQERALARLFSWFGALALLLAGVGLHGVMAHSVASRRHEIGIRMALGATRKVVLEMVLRQAVALSAAGALVGLVCAVGVGRVLASLLYGIPAADPFTFVAAALVLLATCLAAAFFPARRATRIDPATALRSE